MERKRGVEGEGSSQPPPAKALRTAPSQSLSVIAVQTDDNSTPDDIQVLQRAQLAALVNDQRRDIKWLNGKLKELERLVAVLDAAPRAALYHMDAVREDLTLTLSTLGLNGDLIPESSPLAATMLDHEVVTNESLGEVPAALKALSAQIILALEKQHETSDVSVKAARDTNAELHSRMRQVSDQLERYAERDKQSLVSTTTLRDELDDCRCENSMRRTRITSLELALRRKERNTAEENGIRGNHVKSEAAPNAVMSGEHDINATSAGAYSQTARKDMGSDSRSDLKTRNWEAAVAEARELSIKRLEELEQVHAEQKGYIAQIQSLKADLEKRDAGVVPIKAVLSSALYQTMEATLQQLFLKERKWQDEREIQAVEREEERKQAEERITEVKQASEKLTDDYKKQIDELRRAADIAKAEKDKVVMTYEARKMEAGSVATIKAAAEKRLSLCDDMRSKLSASNTSILQELDSCKIRLAECQRQLSENVQSGDGKKLIEKLREELEEERKKSVSFIGEVESLSNMYNELETENSRLQKILVEKEQVLSKVMGERLRARQLLTTIKEENKALSQGRDIDQDRIKALTAVVAASKKLAAEATAASNKAVEETRILAAQLEKRRRIADDATVSSRTAAAEKEEMKRERDSYMALVETSAVGAEENKFAVKRLTEKNAELTKRLKAQEASIKANGKSLANGESVRDEMIRELRKKLNCSVVTSSRKEVVLTRCGHLFSKKCTDDLIATRNRKCPICGRPFGLDDVQMIFF